MTNRYYPEFKCSIKRFITAFTETMENDYHFSGEMHDFWEMIFVSDGSVYVSEDNKVYSLSEGDIIFHKPMEFHKIWVEKEQVGKVMIVSFEADDPNLLELSKGVYKLDSEKRSNFEDFFHSLCESLNVKFYVTRNADPDIVEEKIVFMKFELFLLSLLSAHTGKHGRQYNTSAMNYKTIIDTMNENLDKNLSIDELAALCNLSVSNLKKIFSKYAGGGVMRHFNRLKIKRAMRLLKMGLSIAETSFQLGFSSQNYFAVVFRREAGMLPSEFRHANSEQVKNTSESAEV